MPSNKKTLALFCSALLILQCAGTHTAIKSGYDFSIIKTIVVDPIADYAKEKGSGTAVSAMITSSLLEAGFGVVERSALKGVFAETAYRQSGITEKGSASSDIQIKSPDAILVCTITEYTSRKAFLVPIEIIDRGQTITTTTTTYTDPNPKDTVERLTREKSVIEETRHSAGAVTKTSEIRYDNASIALALRLLDPTSGETIWASNFSYESLSLADALEKCTRGALRPLKKLKPTN